METLGLVYATRARLILGMVDAELKARAAAVQVQTLHARVTDSK